MSQSELKCPICGELPRVYMGHARKDKLCGKHADMLKNGLIEMSENGLFVEIKSGNVLNAHIEALEKSSVKKEAVAGRRREDLSSADNDRSVVVKCIACGRETKNGNLFCYTCYQKYKDKELLVQIKHCKEIEIMDEFYEGDKKCKDGHIVKSKSERDIDNYLWEHGIPHVYEKSVSIDADKRHDLHPDFYLPNFQGKGKDVYIEHWGFNSNNLEYTKSKKYKLGEYQKLGLTVVCTTERDLKDPQASLDRKLKFFKPDIINFADEE